jgi:hypothetical protein
MGPVTLPVDFVLRGHVQDAHEVELQAPDGVTLVMPKIDLDSLVWNRAAGFPAAGLSLDEVLDFLAATGRALERDERGYVASALQNIEAVNPLGGGQLKAHMKAAVGLFDRDLMRFEYQSALGFQGDGWRTVTAPNGSTFEQRWTPARMVHVLAGNTPHGGPTAIIRSSLVRGVALMKLPSNDPFTTVAVLKTMRELDADHPLVQSFSAVYWRGGDASVESVIFRPQFFNKIVAWGGEAAIRNVVKYLGPGMELISFDPKTSISVIGREAFSSPARIREVADLATYDVRYQEGCGTSRHQFLEATVEEADAYSAALLDAMHAYHERVQGVNKPTPREVVAETDGLRHLEPDYRVWGTYDGSGLVVRSDEPVDFYPDGRTVNVVRLDDIRQVLPYINAATQTAGVYPRELKFALRDELSVGGVDRVTDLGSASAGGTAGFGSPKDGMLPLQRFVRWIFSQS